jgi:GntR family transcriptional regulator
VPQITGAQPEPHAYIRLASALRDQITGGELTSGMSAPSITALAGETGHARQTCAKALEMLAGEGLLRRVPGLGYYLT